MRTLKADTIIKIKKPRPELTGDTKIRLSRIIGLKEWHDNLIQDLRKEEYKEIPNVIKNAKQAILEKGTGDFKLLFPDKQNPNKVNKIILSKMNRGNFIVTVGKVDKGNAYEPQKIKVVGEGVAPSI